MRRVATGVLVVLTVALATLLVRGAIRGGGGDSRSGAGGRDTASSAAALPPPVGGSTDFSPAAAATDPGRGTVLVARGRSASVPVYGAPGDDHPQRRIMRRTVEGHRLPVVFRVLRRQGDWLRVDVPVRAKDQRAWVRASTVRLQTTPYRVEIHLRRHRLIAFEHDRVIARARIGVGQAVTPTPSGTYFITDLLRPPDPGGFYGPYAFGLSAYSPVLTSFAGGDGQVGIHGTNQPSALGSDVSHGCIRVDNSVIRRLAARLPLGTPVHIAR